MNIKKDSLSIISILKDTSNDVDALKKIEPMIKRIFDRGRVTGYQDAITLLMNRNPLQE